MHSIAFSIARLVAIALAAFSLCLPRALLAAALTDFGYQHMKVNGVLAAGARPMVVILVNFAGEPVLTNSPSFFTDLVFNSARFPSFNGYLQAVSNGRFSYLNAGVIGPLSLSAAETEVSWPGLPPTRDLLYCSNIVYQAMISAKATGIVDFESYDANQDGQVTSDELQILIINLDSLWGWRAAGTIKPPGFAKAWAGGVSVLTSPTQLNVNGPPLPPFATMVEETEEALGIQDIYGSANNSTGLSPQANNNGSGLTSTYYLDPWNRMQVGWCEPRIRSLTDGGIETISAAQMSVPDSPIILYDPARGTSEFFILEYRTRTSPAGSGYDANVAGNGLAIWHALQDANHDPVSVPSLNVPGNDVVVWSEGPPTFQRGTSTLWGSDTTSPTLNWLNGNTLTHLHVRPFNTGDGAIIVEWLSAEDTWVDFHFLGFPILPELGLFDYPYNTVAEAVSAVSYGGILNIKTGSSPERTTIDKPMTLKAYNGPVTIGQN